MRKIPQKMKNIIFEGVHNRVVNSICVYKGKLFSASDDKSICKWNSKGECIGVLQKHTDRVNFICIHNGFIYSGSNDRTIVKWDDSGNCICVLEGHTRTVLSLISFKGYLC